MKIGCEKCGHLACVCSIQEMHGPKCKFRIAATCAIGIPCEPHGRDTCPICDPCTCDPKVEIKPPQVGAFFNKVGGSVLICFYFLLGWICWGTGSSGCSIGLTPTRITTIFSKKDFHASIDIDNTERALHRIEMATIAAAGVLAFVCAMASPFVYRFVKRKYTRHGDCGDGGTAAMNCKLSKLGHYQVGRYKETAENANRNR